MDDEPKVQQLENRIDSLESTIEKMMPSRRDALKMGGAALAGGSLMAGTASAGTNQRGTIGSASQPVDVESEDINNADTISTQSLDVDTVDLNDYEMRGDQFQFNVGSKSGREDSSLVQQSRTIQADGTDEPIFDLFSSRPTGLFVVSMSDVDQFEGYFTELLQIVSVNDLNSIQTTTKNIGINPTYDFDNGVVPLSPFVITANVSHPDPLKVSTFFTGIQE